MSSSIPSNATTTAATCGVASTATIGDDEPVPKGFTRIIEGTAHMLYDEKEAVFYNKVQVFNRDVSIQVIKLFSEIIESERKEKYEAKLQKYQKKMLNTSSAVAAGAAGAAGAGAAGDEKAPQPPREGIRLLDALAATGLRSVRYLKEIPKLSHITINDILKDATDIAYENCLRNNITDLTKRVEIINNDATILMYQHRLKNDSYDVIDLDPYGSVIPFLDAAVQAIHPDGGLLCITCTDMAVLAGSYPEVCYAKYGSIPLKSKYSHELALRILLNTIDSTANKYKRYIIPWISLSVDFYVRVFVRVYESPIEVKNSCLRKMNVLQATQCSSFFINSIGIRNLSKKQLKSNHQKYSDDQLRRSFLSPTSSTAAAAAAAVASQGTYSAAVFTIPSECPESGSRMKLGGPYWAESLHDQNIINELLKRIKNKMNDIKNYSEDELKYDLYPIPTIKRIYGIFTTISEELKDVPLYYSLPELASTLNITTPTINEITTALNNGGYRVSQFHHDPHAIKTDAPNDVVWDIMRCYAKTKITEGKKLSSIAERILSKEPKFIADFVMKKNAYVKPKVARFQPNPEANWGPKRRAGREPVVAGKDSDLPPEKKPKADNVD